jgi:sulfoxide reductase heme-binding subunit YedZ
MSKLNRWWILKPAVFLLCITPTLWISHAVWLAYQGLPSGLSANPLDDAIEYTGTWTLRFLMITLAITPLRRITGWSSLIRFRRMFGLFAFFQGLVHLTSYVWLDQSFLWGEILRDIVQRPFILSGMIAFVLMLPLALTSTRKWIARLGGSRWQALHRLIYASGIAGVIHYYLYEKSAIQNPAGYAALLLVLLGLRIWQAQRQSGRSFPFSSVK